MENPGKNTPCAIQALNLDQSLDVIKIYFLNDNPTLPKLKEFISEKIADLSPYQYYHLISWLLENIGDEMLLYNLDVIFDFSKLDEKNYKGEQVFSPPISYEPFDYTVTPERFNDDCYPFFRLRFGTMKYVLDDLDSIDLVNRVIQLWKSKDLISEQNIKSNRLFELMSQDDRLNFQVQTFPEFEYVPFYGLALDFIKRHWRSEVRDLRHAISDEIRREAKQIKGLFEKKGSKELGYLFMDNTILLLPILFDFEVWKRLVLDLMQDRNIFHIAQTKIHSHINELSRLLGDEYFSNITIKGRSYFINNTKDGIPFLKTYSPPKIHYSEYLIWLLSLEKNTSAKSISKSVPEKEPSNQLIISKQGSQKRLLKSLTDFFEHLKLKINDNQERALESFIYRNFAFEHDDAIDYTARTVSNFGYKPIDFIPRKHAKDFAKLFLYLSDKDYLLSNKTNIIKTLDEEIHRKEGKNDGFSYSSLIRIPSDEHHLFPNNEIRKRVRSILKIDD